MKQALYLFILLVVAGNLFAKKSENKTGSILTGQQRDSVTSLKGVKVSYTLSNKNLVNLAEKILYKKTPQEDMYLYLLRPDSKSRKALPAIVYFTGGGWVRGTVESQIANPAWFRDHGIIGIQADYRVKTRHGTNQDSTLKSKSDIRKA